MSGGNLEASSKVLGNVLTRPDVVNAGYLDQFLLDLKDQYLHEINDSAKIYALTGKFKVLTDIFKFG